MKPKVVIIGGGIAGLSAGIYAQKADFESVVYEKHTVPGGQCTGWMRNGHYIDNCISWLTGAKEGYDIYSMWKDTRICAPSIPLHQLEAFYKSELNNQEIYLWRDLDKTEKQMLELSPEDAKEIKRLIKCVRYSESFQIPTKKPLDMMNLIELTVYGFRNIKMLPVLFNYANISVGDLSERFKHPLLKKLITDYFPRDYLAHLFVAAYGTIASESGGIPVGGSFSAAQRMANRYKELGGKIICSKSVKEILIDKKKATGIVLENGEKIDADFVICTTDTHHAFEKLIDKKYMPALLKKSYDDRKNNPLGSSFHVAFSYDGVTDKIKGRTFFDCDGYMLANRKITRTNIKNYSFEKTTVPEGKSLLQVKILQTEDEYEYWKHLYTTDKSRYETEKQEAAQKIQQTIEEKYPFTKGKLKLLDVWTPYTYTLFCNAYKGVYMTFMPTKKSPNLTNVPGKIKGVDNLFLAGQWLMAPGGLPVALITGKYAVQRILKKMHKRVILTP